MLEPMYSAQHTSKRHADRLTPKGISKSESRRSGFPHSEISGSKGARTSPELIAACHVLLRLPTPRHPSEALMRLIVLSRTHARGRCRRAWASYVLPDDVFYQVCPKSAGDAGLTLPSRCQRSSAAAQWATTKRRTVFFPKAIARRVVVEPDGIEPTTSCLQSTRSTN